MLNDGMLVMTLACSNRGPQGENKQENIRYKIRHPLKNRIIFMD